jgi:ABC-type bacteriocin/lantibiotic exporter with double-glycine peptidase domain
MTYLKVPYYKQDTEHTCGPASLQMVLEFYGVHYTECELTELLNTNADIGTEHHDMIATVQKTGLYCYVNTQSSLAEIRFLLECKVPVIVQFVEIAEDEDHYSVIVGMNDTYIIFNDPWNGKHVKLPHAVFLHRWRAELVGDNVRWLMAITKRPLPLGKQYYPE